jgi:hypothetical protein
MKHAPYVALGLFAISCGDSGLSKVRPKIDVQPMMIDLGDTPVGVIAKHTVTVQDVGAGPLTITSIALVADGSAPESPDLAISLGAMLPSTLATGSTLTFAVQHVPRDDQLDKGVVRILSNDPARQSVDVPITQSAIPAPKVAAVPDVARADVEADTPGGVTTLIVSVELGAVALGTQSTQTLFIVNAGTGNVPLAVKSIALVDTPAGSGLSVTATPDPAAKAIYLPLLGSKSATAPLRSVRTQVTWAPTSASASISATLRVTTNDPATPVLDLPVHGGQSMGSGPALVLAPPSGLGFGTVAVGQMTSLDVVATNMGQGALVIQPLMLTASASGSFALADSPAQVTLMPGASHPYAVTFRPERAGSLQGTVHISSNDPMHSAVDYPLTGMGGGMMMCTPPQMRPHEPTNDACAGATDRLTIDLPAMSQQTRTWNDEMLYPAMDSNWSKFTLHVDLGCTGSGYLLGGSIAPSGMEQAQICIVMGSCAQSDPMFKSCGSGSVQLLVNPEPIGMGDDICNQFNNDVPVFVQVQHTGGALSCMNYTFTFTAE